MKRKVKLLGLILILSACGSKPDSELIIGTWEQQELIYVATGNDVFSDGELGYEGSVMTFDDKNVSTHNIWYGTPSEELISTYTLDETAKTLTINYSYGVANYDYEFEDENKLILLFSVEDMERKATYTRKLN
jgi:hypothetical protein